MTLTRRNFLFRSGVVLSAAGIGVGTGLLHHAAETKPEPVAVEGTHRVTCHEVHGEIKKVWLGENLVWEQSPRREISWTTSKPDTIPELGTTVQIERNYDDPGLPTERFRATVVSIMEIR